jgi:hypothetical protein
MSRVFGCSDITGHNTGLRLDPRVTVGLAYSGHASDESPRSVIFYKRVVDKIPDGPRSICHRIIAAVCASRQQTCSFKFYRSMVTEDRVWFYVASDKTISGIMLVWPEPLLGEEQIQPDVWSVFASKWLHMQKTPLPNKPSSQLLGTLDDQPYDLSMREETLEKLLDGRHFFIQNDYELRTAGNEPAGYGSHNSLVDPTDFWLAPKHLSRWIDWVFKNNTVDWSLQRLRTLHSRLYEFDRRPARYVGRFMGDIRLELLGEQYLGDVSHLLMSWIHASDQQRAVGCLRAYIKLDSKDKMSQAAMAYRTAVFQVMESKSSPEMLNALLDGMNRHSQSMVIRLAASRNQVDALNTLHASGHLVSPLHLGDSLQILARNGWTGATSALLRIAATYIDAAKVSLALIDAIHNDHVDTAAAIRKYQ